MKKNIFIISFVILTIIIGSSFFYWNKINVEQNKKKIQKSQELKIKSHYNKYVITTKKTNLYHKIDNTYTKVGVVEKDNEFTLEEIKITSKTKYFKTSTGFYIEYNNLKKITNITKYSTRYKNYIPFNKYVKTKGTVHLYQNGNLKYTLLFSLDKQIIKYGEDSVFIEYLDALYEIKNSDILSFYDYNTTSVEMAVKIPVTLYHFIYFDGEDCKEIICHNAKQIEEEFTYLKDNKYFTINTSELYLFLTGKINLPKNSILITIDDGARAEKFIPILEKYKINVTLFLVTSWYKKELFESPYLEVASHSHNLHNTGICKGTAQGGEITCGDRNKLLLDLKTSRDYLDSTEAFSYPFYEFNNYAESIVKEVGFKLSFIGGNTYVTKKTNPYRIPRFTILGDTSILEYKNILNGVN